MGELEVRVETPSIPLDFILRRSVTGQQLVNKVAGLLGLREVQFFGLQFVDHKGTTSWLGTRETLSHLRVNESPLHFRFMVVFWPRDVIYQVSEKTALVLFFRQLHVAVDSGELCCPSSTAAQLAGYAAQVQYGDFADNCQQTPYRQSVFPPGTTSSVANRLRLQPEAQVAWQLKVACLHRSHRGLSQMDALKEYFKLAQELPTYGVTYFEVSRSKISGSGAELWLGVTAGGINVYEDKLTQKLTFTWSSMCTISYSGRKLTIKMANNDTKFVFYASREQVFGNIMKLARGYNEMLLRQRGANPVAIAYNTPKTLSFWTARLSSYDAARNRSVSEGSVGNAAEDSDTPVPRNPRGNASGAGSEAAAVGGIDESDIQDQAGAVAQGWNAADRRLQLRGAAGDSEAGGGDAEPNSRVIGFNLSGDELRDSHAIDAEIGSRKSHLEHGLSLSASESWGPFVQSLMAPD